MEPRQNKPRSNQRGKTQAAKQGKQAGAKKPASGAPQRRSAAGSRSSTSAGKRAPARTSDREAAKRKTRRRTAETKPDPQAPRVVYVPAAPFSRGKLLLQLTTVVAVVLALTFGVSIFFRVKNITVDGAVKYNAWEIQQASGIREGDGLMTFGRTVACGKIKSLPYVDTVRIGIKLPDTVNIVITEFDVLYAVRDESGGWWLMTADGKIIDQVDSAQAAEHTEVIGVRLLLPGKDQEAQALEDAPPVQATGESAPQTVRASDRLSAVLSIAQYLEKYGVIGQVASIDVTNLGRIELQYGQRFLVQLGDTTQLEYKIRCMKSAIDEMKDYESGELDISFTIRPDEIIYTPQG